jgi:GrpB-like predicted nucleotidyltransferase (UPF0157 family)
MPPPIKVELVAHSPEWAAGASEEGGRIMAALGPNIVTIHHVGSTAIPGICAKPILDLIPEVASLDKLDTARPILERCTLNDSATGRRLVQLHCFQTDNPEIERHLAFRDYLRAKPEEAVAYNREKRRCRELHPDDSHAYTDAKSAWIEAATPAALAYYRSRR